MLMRQPGPDPPHKPAEHMA